MTKTWAVACSLDNDFTYRQPLTEHEMANCLLALASEAAEKVIGRLVVRGFVQNRAEVIHYPIATAIATDGTMLGVYATMNLLADVPDRGKANFALAGMRAVSTRLAPMDNLLEEFRFAGEPNPADDHYPPLPAVSLVVARAA